MLKSYLLSVLAFLLYRFLSWSWSTQISEPPELQEDRDHQSSFLLAHWHGDELALLQLMRRYQLCTLSSQSKDGQIMARMIHWLGGKAVRGSSSRGAVSALKGLLRELKTHGYGTSFALDGPRGPIYQIKPGVFEVSRVLGSQGAGGRIYPGGIAVDRYWCFTKSWNQAILPKPFAKVIIHWGSPLGPVPPETDPRADTLLQDLSRAMSRAKEEAHKKLWSPS